MTMTYRIAAEVGRRVSGTALFLAVFLIVTTSVNLVVAARVLSMYQEPPTSAQAVQGCCK
jgi:hypothetical protein